MPLINGNDSANLLNGTSGNDTVSGFSGNDTIYGYLGNDFLYGGRGNDTYQFYAGNGNDTISDTIGGSTLAFGLGIWLDDLTFERTENNDLFISIDNSGNYITLDDYFVGSRYSGTKFVFANGTTVKRSSYPVLYGDASSSHDYFSGTSGNDFLSGQDGDDTLISGRGNDILIGGAGNDYLEGGRDNDSYYVDSADDIIVEYATGGTDTVYSRVDYTLPVNVEKLTIIGSIGILGVGNSLSNKMTGSSGNDTLDGQSGSDSMYGGVGNDVYYVNKSTDKIYENISSGIDTVYSSSSYTLSKYVENLTLTGSGNINAGGNTYNNTITGNDGRNIIKANYGNDIIDGGDGNDTLYGGYGDDSILGSSGSLVDNDYLYGEYGDDTLDGGWGIDKLSGGYGRDNYIVDNPYDKITETGSDIDKVYAYSTPYVLGSGVENLYLMDTVRTITPAGESACIVYGDPIKWGNYLDYYQGDNSYNYLGTCGIVSSQNVLIKAGKITPKVGYSPSDSRIDYQEKSIVYYAIRNHFCTVRGDLSYPDDNAYNWGGTDQNDQASILSGYGKVLAIGSIPDQGSPSPDDIYIYTSDNYDYDLAYYVKNNYGVILAVDADVLWDNDDNPYNDPNFDQLDHAITLTGVAYNASSGVLEGFYITDSGERLQEDSAKFISVEKLASCVGGTNAALNVAYTVYPVYSAGTGNSLDNSISGTVLANYLDGGSGNDILYGGNGDDYLMGGSGNDYLYGGNDSDVYIFNNGHNKDIIYDSGSISGAEGDAVFFESGVSKSNIALFLSGSDLKIDYGSTAGYNQVTVQNYSNSANKIEEICSQVKNGDGYDYYYIEDIDSVITAISQYCASHSINLTSVEQVRANDYIMDHIIAPAWTN